MHITSHSDGRWVCVCVLRVTREPKCNPKLLLRWFSGALSFDAHLVFRHRLSVFGAAHFSSHFLLFFCAKHWTYCVLSTIFGRRLADTKIHFSIKYLFSGRTYRRPFTMYPISLAFIATYIVGVFDVRRFRSSSSLHGRICIYNIIIINIVVLYSKTVSRLYYMCCSLLFGFYLFSFYLFHHLIWFDFRWLGESGEPFHRVYRRELCVCVKNGKLMELRFYSVVISFCVCRTYAKLCFGFS